ncbi:hypothetical protein U9M48_029154 [Paspalum notatum var. saurae]|uniref:Uncharacterized protein n=1 Tax=Paspalum notatum var. saurae TaxID=547442 RepID=A0AAQ3U2F2_PASNO
MPTTSRPSRAYSGAAASSAASQCGRHTSFSDTDGASPAACGSCSNVDTSSSASQRGWPHPPTAVDPARLRGTSPSPATLH